MRPLEEWTDKVYLPGTAVAHIKPFGEDKSVCGIATVEGWYGTGTFDEMEHADRLPACGPCARKIALLGRAPALNEFTAPTPLYAHATPEDN